MSIPHAVTPGPDCGAPLGGREECDAAFHELGAHAASDVRFAYRRRAIVDAYYLQHPADVLSVKSLAAHCAVYARRSSGPRTRGRNARSGARCACPERSQADLPREFRVRSFTNGLLDLT